MGKLTLRVFIHPGGKLPQRGNQGDAGIDVFARISKEETSLEPTSLVLDEQPSIRFSAVTKRQLTVKQFDQVKVPLGFSYAFWCIDANGHREVSHDYWLDVRNRSGVGTQSGMATLAEVGDANYRGELHYCAAKITPGVYVISDGAKLAQALITPFVDPHTVEIVQVSSIEELGPSARGGTGFGQSGS